MASESTVPAASPQLKKHIHPPEVRIPVMVKLPVGGVAGMVATSLIFPLDTIKTLLQDTKGWYICSTSPWESTQAQ